MLYYSEPKNHIQNILIKIIIECIPKGSSVKNHNFTKFDSEYEM